MLGSVVRNIAATAVSFIGAKLWTKCLSHLVHTKHLTPYSARKVMHITTCPLFSLTWPLYMPHTKLSRFFAAIVPLSFALRILRRPSSDPLIVAVARRSSHPTVSSAVDDDTNNEQENQHKEVFRHARGPFAYAVSVSVITAVTWTNNPATYVAFSALCFGDGMADVIGTAVNAPGLKLWPNSVFKKKKTLPGSLACFASTVVASVVWLAMPSWLVRGTQGASVGVVCMAAGAATVIELLPVEDNFTVPLAAFAVMLSSVKVAP